MKRNAAYSFCEKTKCEVWKSWQFVFSVCIYIPFPNLYKKQKQKTKSGWQLGEQMGRRSSVRYVIPEMELMSKYHTCLQENRQGFQRSSPMVRRHLLPSSSTIFLWRMRRWWMSFGQNFHRRKLQPAVFVWSWKTHIKRNPSTARPVHLLPSRLLCSLKKKRSSFCD